MEEKYEDDECGRSKYKGEILSEWSGIFRFEGEDRGERVWIVSRSVTQFQDTS
jgi:hypothetical protein